MKKLLEMFLIILVITLGTMFVMSFNESEVRAEDPINLIDDVDNKSSNTNVNTGTLTAMAGQIISIIQVASAVAAVVLIAVFGFRFILGSAEQKKDYMSSFIPLIVGVVVVFSATSIAKLIFNVANVS